MSCAHRACLLICSFNLSSLLKFLMIPSAGVPFGLLCSILRVPSWTSFIILSRETVREGCQVKFSRLLVSFRWHCFSEFPQSGNFPFNEKCYGSNICNQWSLSSWLRDTRDHFVKTFDVPWFKINFYREGNTTVMHLAIHWKVEVSRNEMSAC